MIEIKTVSDKYSLRKFIHLPAVIHKNHLNWVPPIYHDEWNYLNPAHNEAFTYCETTLALCYKNRKPAGRVMGIINHRYNKSKGERTGRFSMMESIDDQEVASSLLSYVENWARSKGMLKIVGPYGMNYFDPEGFLIEGFEYPPTISTNYNFEYIIPLLSNAGYKTETDYVVYKIDLPNKIPDVYYKIRERVFRNEVFELVEFTTRKEMKKYTRPILMLMNECFTDIYGYSLLDKTEMDKIGNQYLNLLDPRFVKVVRNKKELVGFIVAMPHISDGLRKSKGYLFPFGFLKILKALKHSKQIDLLIGGVKKKFQGTGLDVVLGMSMTETATREGFTLLDSHHELLSNFKVRAEMERIGGIPYKKYRIYQKIFRTGI
jgi:hypothetical protein